MDKELLRKIRIETMQALYQYDMGNEVKIENADVKKVYDYYLENKDKIDSLISSSLVNYTLNRLSYVDRAIVRNATSEMLIGLEPQIAINEALEIVKIYSDEGDKKDVRFINRVLDNIKTNIK